jgi:hypothetical protein
MELGVHLVQAMRKIKHTEELIGASFRKASKHYGFNIDVEDELFRKNSHKLRKLLEDISSEFRAVSKAISVRTIRKEKRVLFQLAKDERALKKEITAVRQVAEKIPGRKVA